VDCAIAKVADAVECNSTRLTDFFGRGSHQKLRGTQPVVPQRLGVEVRKIGGTTGLTAGKLTAIELDNLVIDLPKTGHLRFDDQVEVECATRKAFSKGGDSGSLIVTQTGFALALLIGGGKAASSRPGLTFGAPIETVMDALQVELLSTNSLSRSKMKSRAPRTRASLVKDKVMAMVQHIPGAAVGIRRVHGELVVSVDLPLGGKVSIPPKIDGVSIIRS
jgi:hypothetical protein